MDVELDMLLSKARRISMTPAAIREQRINFAYGNAGDGDEGTKEAVRAADAQMQSAVSKPQSSG